MKINEIITEGNLRKAARLALPDLETYRALDNNNSPYHAYRFGVALALSPNTHMDPEGPIGGQFSTIGYTDADNKIIKGAQRIMGVKGKQRSPADSRELPTVNTQSPVKPQGPVKRKNK